MRKLIPALLVLLLVAGSASAQTATNTATATATATSTSTATITPTFTVTSTRTPTPGVPSTPGSTDFAAFKYGSFKVDASASLVSHSAIINGLKPGDLVVLYPLLTCLATVNTITQNTLNYTISCATDVAEQDVEYLWFSRTQNNCQGSPNCQRAATVTPTPP